MHFKIDRTILYNMVQKVIHATVTNGKMPVFSCIRIEAAKDALLLSATDISVTIKTFAGCVTTTPGALGVNGASLLDILSNFPGGELTCTIQGNRLQLKNKKASVQIVTTSDEQFAFMSCPVVEYIPCHGFFEATKKVDFATVADDASRIWTSGIHISANRLAATDGKRLALSVFEHGFSVPVTVPSDLIKRAHKAVGDKASVAVTPSRVYFRSGDIVADIATLDCAYPDYQRMLPATPFQEVKAKIKDLKEAIDLIKATADQKELTVLIELLEGTMKLTSKSSSGTEGVLEIPAQFEKPGKIAVHIKYLTDVLERLSGEEVIFEHRGDLVPLVVKEHGYVNVIMPKRY